MLMPVMFAAAISVPIPGGIAALARALEIDPPDKARCAAELVRVVHTSSKTRERMMAHFASMNARSDADLVPLPLSRETWSAAIFRRPVAIEELFVAVLSDRAASLVAYGLSALDDDTLDFFAAHPSLLARIYQRDAAVFAAFAAHLRIERNRIVPPGGDAAVPVWEAVVRESVSRPEPFVRALFSAERGRIAYLYDLIGHLDEARAAFALGLAIHDSRVRSDRFQALAAAAAHLFPEWDPRRFPFTRPPHDLLAMLMRVRHTTVDAATLAHELLDNAVGRSDRLDQFGFAQRVFDAHQIGSPDAAYAVRAFPRFPILLLTLERIGVKQPRVYAALARHGQRLTHPDAAGRRAFIHFQAAIALVDRLRRVGTIDSATAETLVDALPSTSAAVWLDRDLRRVLKLGRTDRLEDALVRALAGQPRQLPIRAVAWEGGHYVFDFAASETARIRRFRQSQGGPSVDAALDLHRLATSLDGVAAARTGALVDTVVADALLSMAYAAEWPESARVIRNVARRHDFGFEQTNGEARRRTAWTIAVPTQTAGVPWRLEGSVLALDVALAPLALRRVSGDQLSAPVISSTERFTFVESFGMLNPLRLDDDRQRVVAEAIARGERRIAALARREGDVDEIIRRVKMDGRRARALGWAVTNDPERVASYFSTTELLQLGGGALLDVEPWAMAARRGSGCLCTAAPIAIDRMAFVGRPQLGLLATTVADLHLRVAETLNELQLPAALAKPVLAAAAQEFFDRVRPTDPDDWLTLARAARSVSRERVEDYLSGVTSHGPLVAQR